MKFKSVLKTVISAYVIINVAPVVINGAMVLIKLPIDAVNNLIKDAKHNNKPKEYSNEGEEKIITVKYHKV